MITAGIRALLAEAVGAVDFVVCDMLHDNPAHWGAAATCQAVVICGNPRFTLSEDAWWEVGIWDRLLQLQACGIKVIDGWSGSAYAIDAERPIDEMAAHIANTERSQKYLAMARAITGRITRDPLMQRIYELADTSSVLLPCSSWWAPLDIAHKLAPTRSRNAVSLLNLPGRPDVGQAIRQLALTMQPVDYLASTWEDYIWALGEGFYNVQLVNDAATLLARYSSYQNLLAFRIHAAIPAAAMGCRVHTIGIDTRAAACGLFGIPVTSLQEFVDGKPIDFPLATAPSMGPAVAKLQDWLSRP